MFEHIYFARPDSRLGGQVLQVSRGRMGEILAREAPVEADLVIAVPDSGNAAARGFARASGIPQDDGFVKNRYVARTFIQPGQELRKHGLRMKFNPLPDVVAGKRLVVVDDSIVRGNTTRQIVQMLRDAGASEVHMRISAPPIRHPCHYGIDMSTREEMIAHGRTEAEIAAELGADSLAYLSLGGVYEAIEGTRDTHCDACFSGDYPLANTGESQSKDAFELPLIRALAAPATRARRRGTAPRARGYASTSASVWANEAAGPALAIASQTPRFARWRRRASTSAASIERAASSALRGSSGSRQYPGAAAEPVRAPRQPALARPAPRCRRRAGRRARRIRSNASGVWIVRERCDDGGERERVGVGRAAGGEPGHAAVRVAVRAPCSRAARAVIP